MSGFEQILAPHVRIVIAGGHYRCSCLHTYEQVIYINKQGSEEPSNCQDPDQAAVIDALQAQHLSEVLIKAGAEPPRQDPRQRLRERAERRPR